MERLSLSFLYLVTLSNELLIITLRVNKFNKNKHSKTLEFQRYLSIRRAYVSFNYIKFAYLKIHNRKTFKRFNLNDYGVFILIKILITLSTLYE